jgi:hypothetical protein
MKQRNTEAVRRVLINRTLLGALPDWKDVYAKAREAHPNHVPKIVDPRDLLEGEELPSSFTGEYLVQEFPRVNFEVSLEDQDAFEDKYRDEHPLEDMSQVEAWEAGLEDGMYKHFRARAKYENPKLRGNIGIVFEKADLREYKEAEANS